MDLLLKNIHLYQFKNHKELHLEFQKGINCITGKNGSGKTNILEAIYYLSYCKGYFNPLDSQNIMHEKQAFSIRGTMAHEGEVKLSCAVQKGQKKRFKKDEKEYSRLADHIGRYPAVIISPYDSDLIHEGSDARRKFIDLVISLDDKQYLQDLLGYNRALGQRNNLLKYFWENRVRDMEQLAVWNHRLAELGQCIHQRRAEFFKTFRPIFQAYQSRISKGQDQADISYRSQLHDTSMLAGLEQSFDRDMQRHHTLFGIHKDDMELTIAGHKVKRFGSQGQQKTFLIALKLAQFQFIKERMGIKPLLLLDDVFDKIDDERVAYMVELVGNGEFGQVFITDTSQERLGRILGGIGREFQSISLEKQDLAIEEG